MTITLVGIDLGKRTFHIHAQDAGGREVLRRQMNRVQLVRWLVLRYSPYISVIRRRSRAVTGASSCASFLPRRSLLTVRI